MDKFDFEEKIFGGIFGVIAIIAAIAEMFVNGISASSILGAIKDVFGTLVVVLLLITVIKQNIKPKKKDFYGAFDFEMERLMQKYSPIIMKNAENNLRYDIASKLSAIYDNAPGKYDKFFEWSTPNELILSISKTLFVGRGGSDEVFVEMKNKIISNISRKIEKYDIVDKCESNSRGIKINFSKTLTTDTDASQVVEVLDCIMLIFIAEYKKS